MFLIFDTETTGFKEKNRLVQIAWILINSDYEVVSKQNYIIKPENFTIPVEISEIHGITTADAIIKGVPLLSVLDMFADEISKAKYLIGHNIAYDVMVVKGEFHRKEMITPIERKTHICTMKMSKNYLKLKDKKGNIKNPKLQELYLKLFSKTFDNAHDAMADTIATSKCFFELIERKIIRL